MRIVRNPVLRNDKKILISMIIIAVFMFILTVFDFSIIFTQGTVALGISTVGVLSSVLSVIPLSWGLCASLLLKTKKIMFAKMPAYIISALILIAYIIYYIAAGEKNIVTNILLFSIAVLMIYPFIISTLTLEGRLYNRVFATIFSAILIFLCTAGAIVYFVLKGAIMFSLLMPTLMYVELLLIVFCFRLERPVKKEKEEKLITH